jgi:hypothetical protein
VTMRRPKRATTSADFDERVKFRTRLATESGMIGFPEAKFTDADLCSGCVVLHVRLQGVGQLRVSNLNAFRGERRPSSNLGKRSLESEGGS